MSVLNPPSRGPLPAGSIGVIRSGRSTLLVLSGSFDEAGSLGLRSLAETALVAMEPHLIVDAAGVTFLDGSLMDALAALDVVCRGLGGALRITSATPAMHGLSRLAHLDHLIEEPPSTGAPP